MSGWVKFDKDLPESMRFRRMVKAYCHAMSHDVTDPPVMVVTALIGALIRFWCYVDTHVEDDNTIEATFEEIDEQVGMPGFAAAMPKQWLEQVSTNVVKMPGFLEHNGSSASERKRAAKRQADSRNRKRGAGPSRDVTEGHVLDQTRPDQKRPSHTHERTHAQAAANGKKPPPDPSPKPATPSTDCGPPDEQVLHEAFESVRKAYPARAGRTNWIAAEHNWRLRLDEGASAVDLLAGVMRYAAYVDAGGVSGPSYVLAPDKFFGDVDRPWSMPWVAPAARNGGQVRETFETIHARLVAAGGDDYDDEDLRQ